MSSLLPLQQNFDQRREEEDDVLKRARHAPYLTAVTCTPCKKRKQRCDRMQPCSACQKRKVQCTYNVGPFPRRRKRPLHSFSENTNQFGKKDQHTDLQHDVINRPNSLPSMPSMAIQPIQLHRSISEQSTSSTRSYLGWQEKSDEELDRDITTIVGCLPDFTTVKALVDVYFKDIAWMHCFVTRQRAEFLLFRCKMWPQRRSSGHYVLETPSNHLKYRFSNAALISAICAAALIFGDIDQETSKRLKSKYGDQAEFAHGILLDTSAKAMGALNTEEEPTLDCVRTLLLTTHCLSAVRSPAFGMSALWQAIRIAFLLRLDCDPMDKYPLLEAQDRAQLFASLRVLDWLHAGDVKRHYLILPSDCGVTRHFAIDSASQLIPQDVRIKLAIGSISRKNRESTEDRKDILSLLPNLNAELLLLKTKCFELLNDTISNDERQSNDYIFELELCIEWQLFKLHRPYYLQSWDDDYFLNSRIIGVSIAQSIIKRFHASFFWMLLPQERSRKSPLPTRQPTEREKVYTRVWLTSHSCIAASILLLEHAYMLQLHPTPDHYSFERCKIFEDVKTTRRLLESISSRSSVAKSGAKVLSTTLESQRQLAKQYSSSATEQDDDIEQERTQAPISVQLSPSREQDVFKAGYNNTEESISTNLLNSAQIFEHNEQNKYAFDLPNIKQATCLLDPQPGELTTANHLNYEAMNADELLDKLDEFVKHFSKEPLCS